MNNPQGKGLRDWQASLTPEQRTRNARAGGKARAKALTPKRRLEIATKAARVRAAGISARKQALGE